MAVREGELDLAALEQWLWDAACVIRGPLDAPKFKDYILPLVFLKRLSDVFEEEVAHLAEEFGDLATTEKLVESDHKLVRFYVPPLARWESLSRKTTGVGQELTDAVRAITRENPRLHEPHGRAGFDEVQRDVDPGEFSSGFTRSLQVVSSTDRRHRAPAVGRFRSHIGESIASAAPSRRQRRSLAAISCPTGGRRRCRRPKQPKARQRAPQLHGDGLRSSH